MKPNNNFANLKDSYLFSTIAKKIQAYQKANPDKNIIRLGIGDVSLPLCSAVIDEMSLAVKEQSVAETFKGYGPEQGYDFLRTPIQKYYQKRNVNLELSEIFIGDGAKSDVGNILDIFDASNVALIPDPVYPVYVDTNIMDGRKIIYADANAENGFLPMPDDAVHADLIYLCSPNNPTGAVYSHSQLKEWIDYAKKHQAVILFDAAYEAFVQDPSLPHSIFEVDGAKECAIEFCSFSKTAGFTGMRCGYTIVPEALMADGVSLNKLWLRRQSTKFNGASYIVQRGASAVFTDEGQKQIKANIAYYQENAKIIADGLDELGIWYTGGTNSPYIWFRCPNNMNSWDFFDLLLEKANVVGTPGEGFGENGTEFFRLTAFANKENTIEAVKRIQTLLKK